MELICSQCNTKLTVPDDKLPKDQIVKINCPKCKNKIIVDTRNISQNMNDLDISFTESGRFNVKSMMTTGDGDKPAGTDYSYDDYSGDHSLDFFNEGEKLALLILKDSGKEKVANALEGLGYRCIFAENTRDAMGKLRFHSFNIVVLSDGFDNQDITNSPIMNYLNRVPISSRRKIFLALTGDRFRTMDNMMAFAMSANSVINTKDIDRIDAILKKGLSENEKFYKVLIDTLIEVGKD
jgi:hypothetical protein